MIGYLYGAGSESSAQDNLTCSIMCLSAMNDRQAIYRLSTSPTQCIIIDVPKYITP